MLIGDLMARSGVKFGTSGARGLAHDMTDRVCYAYTSGFLQHLVGSGCLTSGGGVGIAGDFRLEHRAHHGCLRPCRRGPGLQAAESGPYTEPRPRRLLHRPLHAEHDGYRKPYPR